MDQIPAISTAIAAGVQPTLAAYAPLLSANAEAIRGTMRSTHRYGPHARQELDTYRPSDFSKHATAPVLLFLHGGGFVGGAKTHPANELLYANLGHFFADKRGYIVVIPNYRLVGQHDAAFPSGGEDVGLAVRWIGSNLTSPEGGRDLFVLGTSAGGVHAATWALAPQFAADVGVVVGDEKPLRLRGVVLHSTPATFKAAAEQGNEAVRAYYGDKLEENVPLGLLRTFQETHGKEWPLQGVQFLALDAEYDPEDLVKGPVEEFLGQWLKSDSQPMKDALNYRSIEGHNHFSPIWSVGTGVEKEEAWADQVTGFVDNIRRSEQIQRDINILQDALKRGPSAKNGVAAAE